MKLRRSLDLQLLPRLALAAAAVVAPLFALGCSVEVGEDESDLTSLTARERSLAFEGYVYLEPNSDDDEILAAVHRETRSAFGALLEANVAVESRELANVDVATLVKEPVEVVGPNGVTDTMMRVRYRYTDRAIVPVTMARRSSLALGLLHGDYQAQAERVLKECTGNTPDDREMASDVWYVFNPSLSSCKSAMNAEQSVIDAAREAAEATQGQVVTAEVSRLYIPISVSLAPTPTSGKKLYPEYDRLFSGGVQKDTVVVSLLNGMIDHVKPGQVHHAYQDSGYYETMGLMAAVLEARPKLKVTKSEPAADLFTFTVSGKKVTATGFQSFVDWEFYDWGWPAGFTAANKLELRKQVGERIFKKWITFEEKVKVKIGSSAAKPVTYRIELYFGVEDDEAPYRRALKSSDVFIYNGHSYIGEGPLDPSNFKKGDLPQSYQLLFIDSCLSFNYYNVDFFGFKTRGTADLDIISNGVESFSDGSGEAQGKFVAALLGGKQPSYLDLLKVAGTTGTEYDWGKDAMRVVDGELDNVYKPATTKIVVSAL
ncbi:MAG: hypothetical protein EXR75_15795 [Myxococcales bacterium]|nr:hypothetical protein [Myxococcales bacterium]